MERWQIVTGVALGYLAVTLTVGLLAARRVSRDVTGYVAADRGFGLLAMYFVTGGTIFSAFAFLGGPGWAYSRGAAVFYILGYGVLGILPWYFIGPRSARLGRRHGYVTQAQLLTARFPSRTLSALMAVLSVAAFVPYLMVQMSGAGIVFNAVTDGHVPLWAGAAMAYGVVLVYVLVGGASAVGWTNVFEGIVMMLVAWGLGIWLPHHLYGGVGEMFTQIEAARPELLVPPGLDAAGEPWSRGAFASSLLASAIGFAMWPHLFMKAFAARSEAVLRRTVVLFPTFQLFLIPLLLVGFAGVLFPTAPAEADSILPHMILQTGMPAVVVGLFCAGALAASMSTGDALLHGAGSVAIEDGIAPFVKLGEGARRHLMQLLVVAVGALAFWLAVVRQQSLVWLLLTAYGVVDQFAPPIYAALYWRRATTAGAVSGLVAGIVTDVFFLRNAHLRPWDLHEGVLGVVVNVLVLVVVSLLTRPQTSDHVERFVSPPPEGAPLVEAPRPAEELAA